MQFFQNPFHGPPWLIRLMTPLIADIVARRIIKRFPDRSAIEIITKMRAETHPPHEAGRRLLDAVGRQLITRLNPGAGLSMPVTLYSPSSLMLLASNLVPLFSILLFDWPIFYVMLLFWFENVVIGVLNVFRMFLAEPANPGAWMSKLFLIPFFFFHYGLFAVAHGNLVIVMFGDKRPNSVSDSFWPIDNIIHAITSVDIIYPAAALAGSHLFSFLWNYLIRGEFLHASVHNLVQQPYKRVVLLHVALFLGGLFAGAFGSPIWALVFLIVLKIFFDLRAHLKEHTEF